MVFVVDADDVILSANAAALAGIGAGEALAGQALSALVHRQGSSDLMSFGGSWQPVLLARSTADAAGRVTVTALAMNDEPAQAGGAKQSALASLARHVVHELNQPLSVVRMAVGTLRRRLSTGAALDLAQVDGKLARIDEQCVRAANIVETLRMFVPRDHARRVTLDVNRAVDHAVLMMTPAFRELGLAIEFQPGKVAGVQGHEWQIEPVLVCLFGDLRAHLSRDRLPRGPLLARTIPGVDAVHIEIVAEGIDGQEPVAASNGLYLGMDLTMARELLAEHLGELEVTAADGHRTYRVTLPLGDASAA